MRGCKRWQGLKRTVFVALLALSAAGAADAARLLQASPQGEVAQVTQVRLRFDEAVVRFGDPRLPAPVDLQCQGAPAAATAGSGRWTSDREWVFDFPQALPPGTRCQVQRRPDWQPLTGEWSGSTAFRFDTGGPAVRRTQPWQGATIDEDQYFVLELTGPVVEAELPRHAWCEVEGLAEKLPLQVVGGPPREAIVKARRLDRQPADRVLVVGCGRPLPAQARLRLVWGKGIAARSAPQVVTTAEQRFDFRVREVFHAEFSCERERANAPCMPIRPLRLSFSAPVARELAAQVRLQPAAGGAALAPSFDKDDQRAEVRELVFKALLPERAAFTVELPRELKDVSGRPLANAASFPLRVATGDAPPIAKFAAAPFGVVEWGPEAMLPITVRHVQGDLRPDAGGGQIRVKRLQTDAEIIAWYHKLERYHEASLTAKEAGLPADQWTQLVDETDERGRTVRRKVDRLVATRERSLLAAERDTRRLQLPQLVGGDPRPFEVVGIPLPEPGYQVLELESRRLGQALLDKAAPMYVRTGVLVTNLAVHVKRGRENAAVWVTTLDRARPVADAEVAVSGCDGRLIWRGRSDARGLAAVPQALQPPAACSDDDGLFVSARKADGQGRMDMAFVFSGWMKGIEPWRFHVPVSSEAVADERAHTVFDRSLLRAGETVAMKHFIRRETRAGLETLAAAELPTRVKIVHQGSGESFTQPLAWAGSRSALSSWTIPAAAKLGEYRVQLENPQAAGARRRSWDSGSFRVEEFRVPLIDARLAPPRGAPVAPAELVFNAQLSYLAGGGVARAPLQGSALLKPRAVEFSGYDDFGFEPPRPDRGAAADDEGGDDDEGSRRGEKLLADKRPLATDGQGAARFALAGLPPITRPGEVLAEISFSDPNGEVQTVAGSVRVWPAAVVPGIKAAGWASRRGKVSFTALALDTEGRPLKGQALEVRGRLKQTVSSRKRLVGGFYAYDNRSDYKDLGALCSGSSDARGLLACEASLDTAGQVELVVSAKDAQGRQAQAATSVWVTRQGELWFEQDNDDRIDVLPEKRRYEPGENARFQVRMPFREATALVAVEREGLIETRVLTLRGDDPSFELPIDKAWAPNVYVSVLALRGRIRHVPWYSFFDWGWKSPLQWARAFWYEGREYQAPTALVDLAKPAFKLGVAAIEVGRAAHELQVSVTPDQPQYAVRGKALVRVKVAQGGQPVAGAEIAFAAVDEGLLALRNNDSWQLLSGLLQSRAWGVQTATAVSEVIGRRHYGRKAVAAGGGGGRGATRELFDTLLLWQGRVALDARGEALIEVPLNDSLTSFRLVAVADDGAQRFGTGSASIRVSQDLQILPGLPPLVRDGDRFSAQLTLRNTTAREMKLRVSLQGTLQGGVQGALQGALQSTPGTLNLPPQDVVLPAGAARELSWPVDVPADAQAIEWQAAAEEPGAGGARDRLKTRQLVAAAVPLRVQQATLLQLDGGAAMPITLAVSQPEGALPGRGGLVLGLQPTLSGALPGLRRFFETYPFTCLEQQVSRAVGLRDAALWATVANALPTYLDADGLASYFPPRAEDAARGSDRLTAYLLSATHEAGFELPPAARQRMLDGLAAFVEGRIERRFWSPRADLDVRKLAALEALSRHGRAAPRMLGSINLVPNLWPTAAVIDWLQILRRVNGIADQPRRLDEAQQILRGRLAYAGTTLKFSNEEGDFWWWLMDSADANAGRLILAVLDDPAWKDDVPRLVLGALGRQRGGAWATTTANLWGALALDKFGARFESTPIAGRSVATLGSATQALDWAQQPQGGRLQMPWPAAPASLQVVQQGSGKPWLTVQSLAARPLASAFNAGYAVKRSVSVVQRKDAERWSRGDVLRVRLEIEATSDRTWVVLSDPIPGGASILGTGLQRDSQIATRGERRAGDAGSAWTAYEERSFEAFRSYFEVLPGGRHVVEYTLRLNTAGRFALPPTRVEAMYAPETFGEAPNAPIEVAP
ncbi:MAG: alpha-2-macroglobulin [Proteobacteria bacterium]|nr:alpha-2-macroglobulin [Pseudomonadota bacterium]